MSFYTYIYFDTERDVPMYVGKGTGKRSAVHKKRTHNIRLERRLRKLQTLGLIPRIEVSELMSEDEAKLEEIRLIRLYGRRDLNTGTLYNLTDGGDGTSGRIETEISNQKRAASVKATLAIPGVKAAREEAQLLALANPSVKAKQRTNTLNQWRNPEIIAKRKANLVKNHERRSLAAKHVGQRPEVKAKRRALHQDPEYSQKRSTAFSETMRRKRRLNHPFWTEEQHIAHEQFLQKHAAKQRLKKVK